MSGNVAGTIDCDGYGGGSNLNFHQAAPIIQIDPTPRDIRVAVMPDGARTLQVLQRWTEGSRGGLTWIDVPVVHLDESGEPI